MPNYVRLQSDGGLVSQWINLDKVSYVHIGRDGLSRVYLVGDDDPVHLDAGETRQVVEALEDFNIRPVLTTECGHCLQAYPRYAAGSGFKPLTPDGAVKLPLCPGCFSVYSEQFPETAIPVAAGLTS